jgi:uncharacterized membrane protein YwaF
MFDIDVFNPVWIGLIVFFVAMCVLVWSLFKNKSEKAKRNVILAISLANIVLFFVYKSVLVAFYASEGFTAIEYLPLQLCNISLILYPISLLIKNRSLFAFLFFISPLAAFLALCTPEPTFTNTSIFLFKNIGFYCTHGLIFIVGISLVTLDFVKIRYKDVINCFVILFILAVFMLIVNLIFKATFYPMSNYFFLLGPYGSGGDVPMLAPLWNLIPVPLVYMLPVLVVIIPYSLLQAAIVRKVKGYEDLDVAVALKSA